MYGYDPARVVMLRMRTREAMDALAAIRSDDPEARHAMRVIRLMRHNLEISWIPLVEAINSSTAMTAWRRGAGLVDDAVTTVIGRLVEQFGAATTWVSTFGLEELDDERLVSVMDETLIRLLAATDGRGPIGPPWRRLERLLGEAARRSALDDGTLVRIFWTRHGSSGTARVLDVLDRTGRLAALDVLPDVSTSAIHRPLAALLGEMFTHHASALGVGSDRVARSPDLVDLVTSSPGMFDLATINTLTRELLHHTAGTAHWGDRPRVSDTAAGSDALLALVSRSPHSALELLADPATVRAVATSNRFDADVVEALFASALGSGTTDAIARLELLARLVEIARAAELTPGAARGVAVSIGASLPELAVHLDRRLPVNVAVDGGQVVTLGSYADLSGLFGQVMDDDAAQLALGVALGAFRIDQRASAIEAISRRRELTPPRAVAHLAAQLADVTRAVELLMAARADRDDLLAFRHGMALARSHEMVALLGSVISWSTQPVMPMSRQLTTLSTRAIGSALNSSRPRTVPETGIEAELAIHFTTTALALAVLDPSLRPTFGLERVPATTWTVIGSLLDDLDQEADPDERARLHSRLGRVVADDADLDTFLESVKAASGEDRHG